MGGRAGLAPLNLLGDGRPGWGGPVSGCMFKCVLDERAGWETGGPVGAGPVLAGLGPLKERLTFWAGRLTLWAIVDDVLEMCV